MPTMNERMRERAEGEILTPAEAALILKVGKKTIFRRIADGTIKATKIGKVYRIRRENLYMLLS